MSKLAGKHRAPPLLHPSPDARNSNKIQGTASPVKQVKLFLQNAKQNHKQNRGLYFQPVEERTRYNSNEQILRKRINELQLENNQFRGLAKDYELLVQRNKNLQTQMLLLLDELEGNMTEERTKSHQRRVSKDQNHTTQSSHGHSRSQHEDSAHFGQSPHSQEIKIIKAFDSYDEQLLMEENEQLKAQNERIQGLIDHSISTAIANLEQKFMAYINSMEEKLANLAAVNKQVALLREIDDSSKSSKENNIKVQWVKREGLQRRGSGSNYTPSQHSGFSLNPHKTFERDSQEQRQIEEEQNSKVDIKLSYLSESNRSFGNTNKKLLHVTPNSFFKNIEFVDSEMPAKTLFEETTFQQIFHQLSSLRTHLSSIFSLRSQQPSPYLLECERTIQAELKQMLSTYFQSTDRTGLEQENAQLRKKVAELSSQIVRPQSMLRGRQEDALLDSSHRPAPASELYLEQSYYLSLQPQPHLEFEQSKRKLSEVIQIVKNFNRDYRHLLSQSSRGSLLLQSAHREQQP